MIRITHFRNKCIGCNYCTEAAPDTWETDTPDGKIHLKGSTQKKGVYILISSDDEYERNAEAARLCPVKIIRVEKI